jgi:hypothetical protein
MIPAPVSRSPATVPGSGIDVALRAGGFVYILGNVGGATGASTIGDGTGSGMTGASTIGDGTGSAMTGASTIGDGTGSGMTGASTIGDGTGSGMTGASTIGDGTGSAMTDDVGWGSGAVAGDCGLGELSRTQALEKFPGPHTSFAAEAGGAAARW